MRTIILSLVLASILAACGPMHFRKDGITEAEWKRDAWECERDARLATRNSPYYGDIQGAFTRCLEARGYQPQP